MMELVEEKDKYLAEFARFDKEANDRPWLGRLRQQAIDRYAELGFPTLQDEEWRFTNLAPLAQVDFQLADSGDRRIAQAVLRDVVLGTGPGARLVFVNGRPDASLSRLGDTGIIIQNFGETSDKELQPWLTQLARHDEHAFVALNTAYLRDGAFVHIPDGKTIGEPVHIVHISTAKGRPTVSHPRTLILAGRSSSASICETYAGLDGQVYFSNAVTEIVVGENACIDHYKAQREGRDAFHMASLFVRLERASQFSSQLISFGGTLVRNEVNAVLAADGCECTLNGLYMAGGTQHMDNRTVIDHAKPHCTSHELYKGILDGKAHGVFNGKIFVRQDAQKTDAKQTNQTLLLSEDAQINTKPQLEIYADDVKCTHGATVGQLSDEALFYLRSRGIGLEEARGLLTYAFANDVIGRIRIAPLRRSLEELLLAAQHLPQYEHVGDER
jgi:Fe-S cluster assembly protein SufD